MTTEVGSIFPLDTLEISQSTKYTIDEFKKLLSLKDTTLFLSLGRESLSIVARNHPKTKRVLLPRYTCQTVCDPFVELGWEFDTYLINANLRINIESIRERIKLFSPAVVVVHPFYGATFNQEEINVLREIKSQNIIIVADYTQSLYCGEHLDFVDYVVASLRKWFDSPDGGYIYSNYCDISSFATLHENTAFVNFQMDAMYLRGNYFNTGNKILKDISMHLNKYAVKVVERNINPHSISAFGLNRILNSSIEKFECVRFDNYKYLFQYVNQNPKVKFVYNNLDEIYSAPLYFPIFCENRSELQAQLAASKVYAPVLWPIPEYYRELDDLSQYIYDHILVIPVDQRYGVSEMTRICDVLNNFSRES